MTPNAIEILIHCYVSPTPHPRIDAPAVGEEIAAMLRNDLIAPVKGSPFCYRTTQRGEMHIWQLCEMPLPRRAWVNAFGEVLETVAEEPEQ